MKKSQNIHIGHCTTPHGIKGEFSFVLYGHEDSVLREGSVVSLMPRSTSSSIPQDGKEFSVKKINFGNKIIVVLEGVSDRNEVEAMVPFDIYFARENFPDAGDDEYYLNDLLGLEVIDFITKTSFGRVIDFYENGVQVVLRIKTDNEILELLFIEQYVPEVDLENGTIEVIIPEMIE
jgi:16S rRNA processing protein RimM